MRVVTINALRACTGLAALHLYDCSGLQHVDALAECTALTSLTMTDFEQDIDTTFLAACLKLKLLDLSGLILRLDISLLSALTAVESLNLLCCEYHGDLAPLAFCSSLQCLDLFYQSGIASAAILRHTAVPTLTTLSVDASDLQPLALWSSLSDVHVLGISAFAALKPLATCTSLRRMASSCSDLLTLGLLHAADPG